MKLNSEETPQARNQRDADEPVGHDNEANAVPVQLEMEKAFPH